MKLAYSLALRSEAACDELLPMIRDAGFTAFEPTLLVDDGPCCVELDPLPLESAAMLTETYARAERITAVPSAR